MLSASVNAARYLAHKAVSEHGANQHAGELADLAGWLVTSYRLPLRALEIGVLEGGTMWLWQQLGATTWGIDPTIPDRPGVFTLPSQDLLTVERCRQLAPFDLIHIDGGHTEEECRSDVRNYRPLLGPKGVLLVHDVSHWADVMTVWSELATEPGAFTIEHFGGMGIGIIPH